MYRRRGYIAGDPRSFIPPNLGDDADGCRVLQRFAPLGWRPFVNYIGWCVGSAAVPIAGAVHLAVFTRPSRSQAASITSGAVFAPGAVLGVVFLWPHFQDVEFRFFDRAKKPLSPRCLSMR